MARRRLAAVPRVMQWGLHLDISRVFCGCQGWVLVQATWLLQERKHLHSQHDSLSNPKRSKDGKERKKRKERRKERRKGRERKGRKERRKGRKGGKEEKEGRKKRRKGRKGGKKGKEEREKRRKGREEQRCSPRGFGLGLRRFWV